jgi:hypothetical protein
MGTERELEAMSEFIEDNFDPDYGWVTEWEQDEVRAIAYENRAQELLDDMLTEDMKIWTSR